MVQSKATSVDQYLVELPPEWREVIAPVSKTILENLPQGYTESMNWGMTSCEVPVEDYPDTYSGQPLGYLALPAQKRYYSLYMRGAYQDQGQEKKLKEAYKEPVKKMDMGKSCVQFRKIDDLPLDIIGKPIASTPP